MSVGHIERRGEVVTEGIFDATPDSCLGTAAACGVDGSGSSLRAFHVFRMIVGDLGRFRSLGQNGSQIVVGKTNRADPHGRTIAPAAIGQLWAVLCLAAEAAAIAAVGVATVVVERQHKIVGAGEDALGQRHGEHRIVGEEAIAPKQREVFGFDVVEFVDRANDVAGNGSQSCTSPVGKLLTKPCPAALDLDRAGRCSRQCRTSRGKDKGWLRRHQLARCLRQAVTQQRHFPFHHRRQPLKIRPSPS